MNRLSNVTLWRRVTQASPRPLTAPLFGLFWCALGMLGFSCTLTATRLAVTEMNGLFVGAGRAVVAAVLSALLLTYQRAPWPEPRHWRPLTLTALGVVIGFPTLSAVALRSVPASHAQIFVGLSPLATALFASLRVNERPSRRFWYSASLGGCCVLIFGWVHAGGQLAWADLLLLAAVALVGLGYAEGGQLAKELGGARVVCWALLVALPVSTPVALWGLLHTRLDQITWRSSLGFAYVSVISMWLAFFAWYRGLAQGGVARASQIQLLMPVLGILWAGILLGEHLDESTLLACAAVVASTGAHFVLMARNRPETRATSKASIGENASATPLA
ncbi:MAG TPA: DMT family transporter [Polyangiaceae bacterium]|nr:DMT family transporter [Polyangiaceae bacterium]